MPHDDKASSGSTPRRVAFLLCGGRGSRLAGTTDQPKSVLDVAGWPFLRYHLESLRDAGIERFVFLTGYGADAVEEAFGPPSGERVFVAEKSPLGTGGALANSRAWAGEVNWIANGDSFVEITPRPILDGHRAGLGEIVAIEIDDRTDYGGVETDHADLITGFVEKGESGPGLINAGVYLLDRAFLDELPEGVSSLENDHFPRWVGQQRLLARRTDAFFRDIGTPERLAAARAEFGPIRARLEAEGDAPAR